MLPCCRKSNLNDHANGAMNQHRVSMLVRALGFPKSDRELAFQHFGHSGEVNRNIYQAPPAEEQLESTGKYLKLIDEGAQLHGPLTMTKPGSTVSQAHDSSHIYGKRTFNHILKKIESWKGKILNKPGKGFAPKSLIYCFKLFLKSI